MYIFNLIHSIYVNFCCHETQKVSIKVLRKFGVSGNVKVFYKTMNINGSSLYVEEGLQNWIAFEDDVKQKSILIQLRNSTLPMGLSIFQVNLTAVEPMFAM